MVKVVRKPWGYEYPLFESEDVGLWVLKLLPNQSTSLHCHPKKKTGLVVLSGRVKVDFLNDSTLLSASGRVVIRPGLFHRSTALSDGPAFLLEIESPRDKADLVRFEDRYGREAEPYEDDTHVYNSESAELPLLNLDALSNTTQRVGEALISRRRLKSATDALDLGETSTILVLQGSMKSHHHTIVGPGDVVPVPTLERLSGRFEIDDVLDVLIIVGADINSVSASQSH